MEPVIRGVIVYLFLLIVFRLSGKRTLSEASTFDLVLLLIISETTQQAMVDSDHSMTACALLVLTLVGTDIFISCLKQRVSWIETLVDGMPLLLIDRGQRIQKNLDRERVDEADILEAAREQSKLERLDEVKYAVLERGGQISIIPKERQA